MPSIALKNGVRLVAVVFSLLWAHSLVSAQTAAGQSAGSAARKSTLKATSKAKGADQPAKAKGGTVRRAAAPVGRPTFGQLAGLHVASDPLALKSGVALVVDPETDQVIFSKNPEAVLPIASITKLMSALVIVESGLSLDDRIAITDQDIDTEKGSRSRLRVGAELSRGEMLHLALMASENRAAHALGRTFPGGMEAFVAAMNRKAHDLGMLSTTYVEPTGLSSRNQSSANDLALLVREASQHALIRDLSTRPEGRVSVGPRQMAFRNTNGLIHNPHWEILVQKTGYISEAGRCVVMQAQLAGRKLIMVLLDSTGKSARIGDAERLRAWLSKTALAGATNGG